MLDDIRFRVDMVVPPEDSLELAFVRDHHLRAPNGSAEDDFITQAMRASYRMAERTTRRAHDPQTLELVMDRLPCGREPIRVPRPPLLEILSFEYIDENGQLQELTDAQYRVSAPIGPTAQYGFIEPAYDETWATTRRVVDAVTIQYRAGYVRPGSPATSDVPEDITHGRLLVIAELYKTRSLSVHAPNQSPAVIQARELWLGYRVY